MSVKRVSDFVCKDNPFRFIREPKDYSWHHRKIESGKELRATLRAGQYAWPGGYPLYLIADDCQPVCFDCVKSELYNCIHSIRSKIDDGWRIVGCDINFEDVDMTCSHCECHIESAYGEDNE